MTPEDYGRQFPTVLATVELACHTTRVSTGRNGHEPPFKDWILLGTLCHRPEMGDTAEGLQVMKIRKKDSLTCTCMVYSTIVLVTCVMYPRCQWSPILAVPPTRLLSY